MNQAPIKTRFAPSPTGALHLGNLRTALFNALYARGHDGCFVLRIEDTDAERSRAEYTAALQADLHWLGLDWQEGPEVGGAAAPYLQSERAAIYAGYFQALEASDHAYPCFCSQQVLSVARKVQQASGRPPRYPGTCARLTPEQREAKRAQGLTPTLRFRVPDGHEISFEDYVRGHQSFRSDDIGDFVIRRSDGSAAFFFSNAVDDALMGVTQVLRGEDHLANTPRQLLLLEALDMPAPQYGHIALIVGDDGSPLSKRHGSRSIRELSEEGILPLALINHLARVGHTYESDVFMDLAELAAHFALGRLGRAPARHDPAQLLHWQKEAVARCSDTELWAWMCARTYQGGQRIQTWVPEAEAMNFVHTVRDNIVMPLDAYLWAGSLYAPAAAFDPDARHVIIQAGAEFFRAAQADATAASTDFKTFIKQLGTATGRKGKELFMPLRAALSGQLSDAECGGIWRNGPELARIAVLLGETRLRERLQAAQHCCELSV
ncbi:MAG TPA: glutamate--tRNA ligase [Gammaproteobacteria bacterium]|nr:glutamate--tRNA ligase [Gammaproteobacteria bacterium]